MTDFLFNWLPFLGAVGALLFGCSLLWIGSSTYIRSTRLKRHGLPGLGRVTERYRERITRRNGDRIGRSTRYRNLIDFEFSVSGARYGTQKARPSQAVWDAAEPGTDVEIIFLPGNPNNNCLAEHGPGAGQAGGTVQMTIGTLITSGAALYLVQGFLAAIWPTDEFEAQADWVRDRGEVYAITISENPFVRIARPNARLVKFAIGDSDGGRNYVGYLEMVLASDEHPGIKEGDILPFLRHPENKYRAVLIRQ